ncbi:MAG: permease [Candidatus Nanoarchaeia archaeon]
MISEAVNASITATGIDTSTALGGALHFFIYDTIKILLLLFVMISVIGVIRSYLPRQRIRKILSGKKEGVGNIFASLFGTITPFCSCSSIPIFMGFLEAGVPLGVTFSFLITSPLVNEYLVVLMLGFFGIKITALYVLFGLLVGIIGGIILGRLKAEKYLEKDFQKPDGEDKVYNNFQQRVQFGLNEATSIVKKLWLWILLGVGLGAVIHNLVPDAFVTNVLNSGGIFTIPLAVLIGIPFYANCAAILPVADALFQKGLSLGTALAFMMATSALSLPEAIILRRAMKLKLIAMFFGIVAFGIVMVGFLFNLLEGIV